MEFFKYSKELVKIKNENKTYTTNPFSKNKQVTFVWVEKTNKNLFKTN